MYEEDRYDSDDHIKYLGGMSRNQIECHGAWSNKYETGNTQGG